MTKKHYVGAPKKFVKPHNVSKSTYISILAYPHSIFCKIAISKNSDLCSNHIYNVNGVSTKYKIKAECFEVYGYGSGGGFSHFAK